MRPGGILGLSENRVPGNPGVKASCSQSKGAMLRYTPFSNTFEAEDH